MHRELSCNNRRLNCRRGNGVEESRAGGFPAPARNGNARRQQLRRLGVQCGEHEFPSCHAKWSVRHSFNAQMHNCIVWAEALPNVGNFEKQTRLSRQVWPPLECCAQARAQKRGPVRRMNFPCGDKILSPPSAIARLARCCPPLQFRMAFQRRLFSF